MVKLFCALVGAAGSAFSVRVDESDTVDDLKKAIKAENGDITCAARRLNLYLAKKGDAWMTENEIKEVGSISGLKHLNVARARLRRVGLSEDDMNEVDEGEEAAGNGPVNVLVVVPAVDQEQRDEKRALPRTSVLNESDKYAEECISLREWGVGAVHEIPFIWKFMSSLGGCTSNGKIFWRLEDKQVVSILDDGWFRESTPDKINTHANKRSILMGSPGIGKSTMLCLMAFYLVFKHQKNVLVYRRLAKLNQSNCLLYLGHQGNRVVHFAIPSCTDLEACRIYGELSKQQGIENIWLLLDGLKYEHVPQELETFNLLATSQQVSLTSQERVDTYCCLLPCWAKKDLWLMGNRVYNYTAMDMEERFYYSGGSVREFTLATSEEIRNAIDDAVSGVDDVSNLLSNNSSVLTGKSQVDRLRHTFVKNPGDTSQFTARRYWEQVIDSEYAVLSLSVRLRSDALFRIYQWARGAGHGSLAGSVFEIYLHRLAADKTLRLYISEYDPPERRKPNEPRHLEVKQVYLKNGGAICCGTASDHESHLEKWRDDEKLAYWFPACHDFPNIDSIVKLEPTSDMMSNIAYLQMTIAAEHEIDGKELKRMNAIFFPDDVKDAGDIKPSIYIAVCPDLKSCESLILKPGSEVLEARKACRVFVGYYDEAPYATAADGPMNNIPIKPLPPPPPYNLRKRLRTE